MSHRSKPVLLWIFFLTITSGYINVSTIAYYGIPTTHHTGNVSQFAMSLYPFTLGKASLLIGIMVAFVLGSAVSGYLFHNKDFYPKRRYGLLLIGCGAILSMGWYLNLCPYHFLKLISFLAGIQNGMFIHYRGLLVRTTHMSGYLSDAGFNLGCSLKDVPGSFRKSLFYFSGIFCFTIGGLAAAFSYAHRPLWMFPIASSLYGFSGLYYFLVRHYYQAMNRSNGGGDRNAN